MNHLRSLAVVALLLGGVAAAAPPETDVLRLTLKDAIERGLAHNLAAILGRQAVREAEADHDMTHGALLPSISAGVSGFRETIDLQAYGFPVPPGGSPVVGPFNVFDARLYLEQPLLDLAAVARSSSKSDSVNAARFGAADAREVVVLTCAGLYMQAAIAACRIDSARAQEAVAQALLERAQRLKDSGVVAGIEVLRAEVQLQAQRQRVIFSENEFEKQKLALARAIGLPMSEPFELADRLPDRPMPAMSVEDAMASAAANRADLLQAEETVRAGEATVRASRDERLPRIVFNADYGVIGPTTPELERTFSVGVGLRLPLFEGGRIRALETRDDAKLERLRAERDDLRTRVELDVRSAILDLRSSGERLAVSRDGLDLAEEQLRQSEDRFGAGVSGNLEVVQAQDAVATASDNYLSATFAYNLARFALARAVGGAERTIPTFLSTEDAHHE